MVAVTHEDMEAGSPHLEQENILKLRSSLGDMERLAPWIDNIVERRGLEERVRFGVHLCLEEVVSNVIRHGYREDDAHDVTVSCDESHDGRLVFAVEDDAACFNPLEAAERPAIQSEDNGQIGGQGIRLLRSFADTLEYEARPHGNCLRIGFVYAAPASTA